MTVVITGKDFTIEKLIRIARYKEKIIWIPNGINLDEINEYRTNYRNKHHNGRERVKKILFVGRLESKKGIGYLLEVFQKISSEIECELWIVGDGPLKSTLPQMLKQMGIKDKTIFKIKIPRDELYKIYAQSDLFILLSEYEAHSMSLTEAMAFGLVPIATNVGGNKYLITNGENGFLVKYPPDIMKVKKIAINLLKNSKLLSVMSKNSILQSQQFNTIKMVDNLENTYNAVIKQ